MCEADPNEVDIYGNKTILYACENNDVSHIKLIISNGYVYDKRVELYNPLFTCIENNAYNSFKYIYENYNNINHMINYKNKYMQNLTHFVCEFKSRDIYEYMKYKNILILYDTDLNGELPDIKVFSN